MAELFDDVARTLATTPSRRRALGAITGALTSAAVVSFWPRSVKAQTACAFPLVACGQTGQCLPTSGASWTCCGYRGTVGSGTACGPGLCNSAKVCCQGGTRVCGATCCQAGGSCCNAATGLCCAPNAVCQNGTCVPRGAPGGGAPGGGVPGQPPTSCPPGAALCGTSGQCCPTSGMGQCCGTGASAVCCWGGTCNQNGVCVRGAPRAGGLIGRKLCDVSCSC